ncbi:hypothetical protein LXL04_036299 [Taraxacum kok-saghyz]
MGQKFLPGCECHLHLEYPVHHFDWVADAVEGRGFTDLKIFILAPISIPVFLTRLWFIGRTVMISRFTFLTPSVLHSFFMSIGSRICRRGVHLDGSVRSDPNKRIRIDFAVHPAQTRVSVAYPHCEEGRRSREFGGFEAIEKGNDLTNGGLQELVKELEREGSRSGEKEFFGEKVYGSSYRSSNLYLLITLSIWFLVVSRLFAPFVFNPSGFDWQKTVEDWTDWKRWMGNTGGIGRDGCCRCNRKQSSSSPRSPFLVATIWVRGPVIVGAGPSGLAAAACLRKKGVPSVMSFPEDLLWRRRNSRETRGFVVASSAAQVTRGNWEGLGCLLAMVFLSRSVVWGPPALDISCFEVENWTAYYSGRVTLSSPLTFFWMITRKNCTLKNV